jgi:hypothetical protein
VCIDLAINVNNSDVVISGSYDDFFNVVFVYDEIPVEREKFTFWESKEIDNQFFVENYGYKQNISLDYDAQGVFILPLYRTAQTQRYFKIIPIDRLLETKINFIGSAGNWFYRHYDISIMSLIGYVPAKNAIFRNIKQERNFQIDIQLNYYLMWNIIDNNLAPNFTAYFCYEKI